MTMIVENNLEQVLTNHTLNESSGWSVLYCSHIWNNSNLRNGMMNPSSHKNELIKYCFSCKGKIRRYEIKSANVNFVPNNHSTPNGKLIETSAQITDVLHFEDNLSNVNIQCNDNFLNECNNLRETNIKQCIPSISRRVEDSSFRQEFTSQEIQPTGQINRNKLRKTLKGFGCIVNFALTDSPVKKRTQIRACSISVMIVAIVVISFILVNFATPNFTYSSSVTSTIVVPKNENDTNETTSGVTKSNLNISFIPSIYIDYNNSEISTTSEYDTLTSKINLLSQVMNKIRKNIKTFPKKIQISIKPNRDLSPKFCSCQKSEVCMLEENSGLSVCKKSIDDSDPTGCGGLCALDTEACQIVDKARGVRVCRLLTLMTCSTLEWRCRNGLCVPAEARCDGSIQCYDRSDEIHCDCDLKKQFRCGHSISCFPKIKLCDGVIDCWDGFDEVNCTIECPKEQFTCTSGQCIPSTQFCDGLADCEDFSDEPQGCGGDCGAHEMQCANKRCVMRSVVCDGHDNCGDASDEQNCSIINTF